MHKEGKSLQQIRQVNNNVVSNNVVNNNVVNSVTRNIVNQMPVRLTTIQENQRQEKDKRPQILAREQSLQHGNPLISSLDFFIKNQNSKIRRKDYTPGNPPVNFPSPCSG